MCQCKYIFPSTPSDPAFAPLDSPACIAIHQYFRGFEAVPSSPLGCSHHLSRWSSSGSEHSLEQGLVRANLKRIILPDSSVVVLIHTSGHWALAQISYTASPLLKLDTHSSAVSSGSHSLTPRVAETTDEWRDRAHQWKWVAEEEVRMGGHHFSLVRCFRERVATV